MHPASHSNQCCSTIHEKEGKDLKQRPRRRNPSYMQHNCGNHSTFESITGDISASDHGVPSSHEIRKRVSTSEQDLEAKLL